MKYRSFCSGIAADTVAWQELGWQCLSYSEIEPFPCALLKYYYPRTPNLGDMTGLKGENLDGADVFIAGTPCQSFSVAGRREGLDDPRGNLTLEFFRLAIKARVRWIVWENVPGLLSDDGGRTLGIIYRLLAEHNYFGASRILDAQFFGVPQRRRRLFSVFYLGDWRPPTAVLLERESLCGYPSPSRKTGEEVAGCFAGRSGEGGSRQDLDTCGAYVAAPKQAPEVAAPITKAFAKHGGRTAGNNPGADNMVVGPICAHSKEHGHTMGSQQAAENNQIIVEGDSKVSTPDLPRLRKGCGRAGETAKWAKGTGGPAGDEAYNLVTAFDAKKDGENDKDVTPPLRSSNSRDSNQNTGGQIGVVYENHGQDSRVSECRGMAPTVHKKFGTGGNNVPFVADKPKAFQQNTRDEVRFVGGDGDKAGCVSAEAGMKQQNYILEKGKKISAKQVQWSSGGGKVLNDSAQALRKDPEANYQFLLEKKEDAKQVDGSKVASTLRGFGHGWQGQQNSTNSVMQGATVRRLTPRECELLQGFPLDYTAVPFRKYRPKDFEELAEYYREINPGLTEGEIEMMASDGARYRALGNAMAVPVMRWIGRRIEMVEAILKEQK